MKLMGHSSGVVGVALVLGKLGGGAGPKTNGKCRIGSDSEVPRILSAALAAVEPPIREVSMKRLYLPSLALAATLAACGPQGATTGQDTEVDRQAIRELNNAYTAGVNSENADALAGLYTDEAVLLWEGRPAVIGRSNVRAALAQWLALGDFQLSATVEEVEVVGDLSYYWGSARGTLTDSSGNESAVALNYLDVCKRQPDGSWKISHHMNNNPNEAGS